MAPEVSMSNQASAQQHWLLDIKTEHQYLGLFSIEKLCAFNAYQERTSIYRVLAVIVLTTFGE
ncbi:hypothetical protein V7S43_018617 [Phytophthora oleae]|uniref:Uncharacterized protein n=1 Tax=Phytophthora oleae TaxID=2107226 RepID=A0ABD3EQ30_9STRA